MSTKECGHEGCGENVEIRGFCSYHYNLAIRNNSIVKEIRCSEPGCDRNHYAVGLCYIHYTRKKRNSDSPCTSYSDNEISIIKENYNQISMDELLKLLPNRTEQAIRSKARKLGFHIYEKNQDIHDSFAGRILKYIPESIGTVNFEELGYEGIEDFLDDNAIQIGSDIINLLFAAVDPNCFNAVMDIVYYEKTFQSVGDKIGKQTGSVSYMVTRSIKKIEKYVASIFNGLVEEPLEKLK